MADSRDQPPVIQGKPLVFLDNAASSQMPRQVLERLQRYRTSEHANIHRGVHFLSQAATDAYEEARRKVLGLNAAKFFRFEIPARYRQ
mgnify:CR=1 FL=1